MCRIHTQGRIQDFVFGKYVKRDFLEGKGVKKHIKNC